MKRLEGKVALISGGARGMGASHAKLFAEHGAKVIIGDVLDAEGQALAGKSAGAITFAHLDVTNYADWENAVAVATDTYGGLDIVVNNAGINILGSIEEVSIEEWDRIIAINLTGVFYGIRSAVPALKRSDRNPSIINISSTAGILGYEGITGYNTSKFAVRGLTKNAALDLGKYNIRVNSVHPGMVRTPLTEQLDTPQNHVALHRVGEPEELSNLVLFLASDDSTFSTGAEFVADGGETAGAAHYE
jgi:3alpha(or 20beta)-hydroxysteroid dehydrogenase